VVDSPPPVGAALADSPFAPNLAGLFEAKPGNTDCLSSVAEGRLVSAGVAPGVSTGVAPGPNTGVAPGPALDRDATRSLRWVLGFRGAGSAGRGRDHCNLFAPGRRGEGERWALAPFSSSDLSSDTRSHPSAFCRLFSSS